MLFGLLHRVAIVVIDFKESTIYLSTKYFYLHVKFVRKIMQIFSSSICALYISAVPPIYLLYCSQICRIC